MRKGDQEISSVRCTPEASTECAHHFTDFLQTESKAEGSVRRVPLAALWTVLIDGLNPIWPNRLSLGGVSLGDVWSCPAIQATEEGDDLVPFHKLTQWLTYSLMETIKETLKWEFDDTDDMTGLPEYRNGIIDVLS